MNTQTQLSVLCSCIRGFVEHGQPGFENLALDLFSFQYALNIPYQRFCNARRKTPETVNRSEDIPALPTASFKQFDLTVLPPSNRTTVFHSSGTTEHRPSRHFHSSETLQLYEEGLCEWFKPFVLPDIERANFLVLTPRGAAVPHSSLVHMFETVVRRFAERSTIFAAELSSHAGWELDFRAIERACATFAEDALPVVICGTAFSFVHLFDYLTDTGQKLSLPKGSRVFETGGYKGRSRSIPKEELHALIENKLQVPQTHIISEYGMSELSSQAYDQRAGETTHRIFRFPPWTRAMIISPETGGEVVDGDVGLVRVMDLANVGSVMAVQTEDLAVRRGLGFELIGRASMAEPRGCSLMELRS
jgi:hypothetical protein